MTDFRNLVIAMLNPTHDRTGFQCGVEALDRYFKKQAKITKMFRGTPADRADCIAAFATGQVDAEKLFERYSEAARYDLNPKKVIHNFAYLAEGLHEKQLIS